MTQMKTPSVGTIAWLDLTVPDADSVRDFYRSVVGWETGSVDMGGYNDYNMLPPGSAEPVAGVCHARGSNAGLPAQWLLYIVVADVDRSTQECVRLGGRVIAAPRAMGGARYSVIQDPAGAVCGLYQPAPA